MLDRRFETGLRIRFRFATCFPPLICDCLQEIVGTALLCLGAFITYRKVIQIF